MTFQMQSPTKPWSISQPILFEIVEVKDITKSDIQAKEIRQEAQDRNKAYSDRRRQLPKMVHQVNVDDDAADSGNGPSISSSRGLYKLTLKDEAGTLCYAYEVEPLRILDSGGLDPVKLGTKLLVTGGNVTFNVIGLENRYVKVA